MSRRGGGCPNEIFAKFVTPSTMQINFMCHPVRIRNPTTIHPFHKPPPPPSMSTTPRRAKAGDKSLKYFTDRKIQELIPDSTFYPFEFMYPPYHIHCYCWSIPFTMCHVGLLSSSSVVGSSSGRSSSTLSCSVLPLTRPSSCPNPRHSCRSLISVTG